MEKEYGVALNLELAQFKKQISNIQTMVKNLKEKNIELNIDTNFNENDVKTSIDKIEEQLQNLGGNLANDVSKNTSKMSDNFLSLGNVIKNVFSAPGVKAKLLVLGGTLVVGKLIKEITKAKKKIAELEEGIKKLGTQVVKNSAKGVSGLKNFALSLFGIQNAFRNVSKAVSSYLSFDSQLSQSISNIWAGFGSFLAPILEYVVSLFEKILAYANALIYAFTGVNLIARANAKAINQIGKSATSTAKAIKQLGSFDELHNINTDNGSGSGGVGGGANQITLPEVDLGEVNRLVNIVNRIKELIQKDDWTDLGIAISDKIISVLDNINWDKIRASIGNFGKKLAQLINGLLFTREDGSNLGKSLGTTLAGIVNSAVEFLYNFVTTLNWSSVGKNIADGINTAITNIDWKKMGETINKLAEGILTLLQTAIKKIDWKKLKQAIIDFYKGLDYKELGEIIGEIILTWEDLKDHFEKVLKEAHKYIKKRREEEARKQQEERRKQVDKNAKDTFDTIQKSIEKNSSGSKAEAQKQGEETFKRYYQGADKSILSGTSTTSEKTNKSGITIANSLKDGLKSIDLSQTAEGMSKSILDTVKNVMGISNNESKETKTQGKDIAKGLVSGIDEYKTSDKVNGILNNLKTTMNNTLNSVSSQTSQNGNNVGSSLKNGIQEGFLNGISGVINNIKKKLNDVIWLFNKTASNINTKFNIKTTANVASDIGSIAQRVVSEVTAKIGQVPYLSIGTDEVLTEGLAYLHSGERVVPADVAKGGYSGSDNEETNNLLRQLISLIDEKDFEPYIRTEDIGKASVNYINNRKRITGEAIV